jgi:hypothetical protein
MTLQFRPSRWSAIVASVALTSTLISPTFAQDNLLRKGTKITLVFDTPLNSKTVKLGDSIAFHVQDPVELDGKTIIAPGAKTMGAVEKINKRQRYGINASIRLDMSPLHSVSGQRIPLGFKTEGPVVSGKTGGAIAATAGGALLLGPVGLIGGVFITGKSVDAKPGDIMTVTVDHDTMIRMR